MERCKPTKVVYIHRMLSCGSKHRGSVGAHMQAYVHPHSGCTVKMKSPYSSAIHVRNFQEMAKIIHLIVSICILCGNEIVTIF